MFGNVVLSWHSIREHAQLDLSWKTCEPRNCQRAAIDINGLGTLQIFNVPPRDGVARAPLSGEVAGHGFTNGAFGVRWCSATSTSGRAGSEDVLVERLQSLDSPASATTADVSRILSRAPPRSHLFRRTD
jgi:hypothetical protein